MDPEGSGTLLPAGLVRTVVHSGELTAVEVSPDGSLLATASNDGTAWLWRLRDGVIDSQVARPHRTCCGHRVQQQGEFIRDGQRRSHGANLERGNGCVPTARVPPRCAYLGGLQPRWKAGRNGKRGPRCADLARGRWTPATCPQRPCCGRQRCGLQLGRSLGRHGRPDDGGHLGSGAKGLRHSSFFVVIVDGSRAWRSRPRGGE